MKKFKLRILTFLLFSIALSGCNQSEAEEESRISLIKATNPSPVQLTNGIREENIVDDIKKDVMKFNEIYDVAIIKVDKNTIVVYKVKHMYRFRMKAIEKRINKKLENSYPNEKFTVSSDYKIFMEALELKEKTEDPNYSKEKAEKKLKKIIDLKEERT
ncbi:sporulation protein [Bacillus sp. CGMCC 1.16607]|uniref:sporulation protein n=1 Tax=Bacillus sp. CGMCC 1.16607 TaxID=3351842 RepID=UPI0036397A20